MNAYIENFKKYVPPSNTGYTYVKFTEVFVPIKDVGLEILERRIQMLPFLFETILSLLKNGVANVYHLAELLGLEGEVYNEIIAQMGNLLSVSGDSVTLTRTGEEALSDLKKVTKRKTFLNNVYVNTVTGELLQEAPKSMTWRPTPNCMCLDQAVSIDVDYFRKQKERVGEIYHNNLLEEAGRGMEQVDKELFQILSVDREKTQYFVMPCFVFVHQERGDVLLIFENDLDSIYLSTAISQIRSGLTGAVRLFDGVSITDSSSIVIDRNKQSALDDLVCAYKQRGKPKHTVQEIDEMFYNDRYLLSGELEELILGCNAFRPKSIFLQSSSIRKLLDNNSIVSVITAPNIDNLMLVYNKNEYNVAQSIDWVKKSISGKKPLLKCYPQTSDSPVTENRVIVSPGFSILTSYEQISTSHGKNRVLHKEISEVTFSNASITADVDKIKQTYSVEL
jgi:hypothetical protein